MSILVLFDSGEIRFEIYYSLYFVDWLRLGYSWIINFANEFDSKISKRRVKVKVRTLDGQTTIKKKNPREDLHVIFEKEEVVPF